MESRGILDRSARRPDFVVLYGDHVDAVIDVFVPPHLVSGPLPLMVLLHGGFWRSAWDRTHLRPMAEALAGEGFVVATPEYRRIGDARGWPLTRSDVSTALASVRDLLDRAAPGRTDAAAPLTLAGHSAGGQLALWGGLHAGPSVVERIVALAPVADLAEAARLGLDHGAAQDLLGGEPDAVPEAYADADVRRLLPGAVPVTVVHGDADQRVPVSMSRALADAVRAGSQTAPFRYDELPGVDHFALIDPESSAWPTVLRALLAR